MMDSSWQDELTRPLRTLQIIVAALVTGVVVFLGIVLALGPGAPPPPQQPAGGGFSLTTLAVVFTVVVLIVRLIVPGVIASVSRRKIADGTWAPQQGRNTQAWMVEFLERTGDAGKLTYVFMNRTIIAGALIEGATFFTLIAHMLEGTTLSLIVAAMLIASLLLHFPTRSRLVGWIEDQLVLIEQERQLTDLR